MNRFDKLVKDEIRNRLVVKKYGYLPKRLSDSRRRLVSMSPKTVDRVLWLADTAMDLASTSCRRRHCDFAFLPFLIGILLPVLIGILKASVIGALSGSLKQNVIDPIVRRLIENIKAVAKNKGNKTYVQAYSERIKKDMKNLSDILQKEKAPIANKVRQLYTKFISLFAKEQAKK